ncbi:MAG: GTPase ObgE [Candidatus Omnitrophica bacterium]|nr:GTPase ObgE [Candidatus Omnitrophota bacterium]
MLFVDRAHILIIAGNGGNGCSAMFKQPYSRYPRPNGGDGGDGGDVILLTDPQLTTLLDVQFRHEFQAERGRHGMGNTKTGRRGKDCVLRVPVGTIVQDRETGHVLRDLIRAGERIIIAHGGRGGMGNARGKGRTAPGRPGEQRELQLELKLLADVGLVGFPNAGKSSLLSRISTARPTVAAYPFTTKTPVLGVVSMGPGRSFVACDIPGLIEGAHEGRGLGMQFLRHVERTRLLVQVVDLAGVDARDPIEDFHTVRREVTAYHAPLAERPYLVAANKMDLPEAQARLAAFRAAVPVRVYPISCATGEGIPELLRAVWTRVQRLNTAAGNG